MNVAPLLRQFERPTCQKRSVRTRKRLEIAGASAYESVGEERANKSLFERTWIAGSRRCLARLLEPSCGERVERRGRKDCEGGVWGECVPIFEPARDVGFTEFP
jgi:hypothetical protein